LPPHGEQTPRELGGAMLFNELTQPPALRRRDRLPPRDRRVAIKGRKNHPQNFVSVSVSVGLGLGCEIAPSTI
jgi:hypothetical protein